MSAEPLIAVIIGPGGVGKGTIARALVAADPRLWLSRSWTTRPRRSSEDGSEYVFVDGVAFDRAIAEGTFLEWAEFQGHRYGTPWPSRDETRDVLLEIDVQGAEQVRRLDPRAVVFLILPPTMDALEARLRGRGDAEEHVERRLLSTPEELARGQALADHVIINDDLDRAVAEILSILEGLRDERRTPSKKD